MAVIIKCYCGLLVVLFEPFFFPKHFFSLKVEVKKEEIKLQQPEPGDKNKKDP